MKKLIWRISPFSDFLKRYFKRASFAVCEEWKMVSELFRHALLGLDWDPFDPQQSEAESQLHETVFLLCSSVGVRFF